MPVYEYLCASHGAFEQFRMAEDRHNAPCPVCGAQGQKQLSMPQVIALDRKFDSDEHRGNAFAHNKALAQAMKKDPHLQPQISSKVPREVQADFDWQRKNA